MIETERRETGTLIGSDKVEGTGCVRRRQPEDWLDRAVMINKVSGHSHAMHEGSIGSLLRLIHTTLARPTAFPTIGPRLGAQPIALLLLGQTSRSIAPVNRFWRTQNALSSACSFRTAGASIVGMTGGTGFTLPSSPAPSCTRAVACKPGSALQLVGFVQRQPPLVVFFLCLDGGERHHDVLFVGAQKSADADDKAGHLPDLSTSTSSIVPIFRFLRIADVLLVVVGHRPALLRSRVHCGCRDASGRDEHGG